MYMKWKVTKQVHEEICTCRLKFLNTALLKYGSQLDSEMILVRKISDL